MLYLIHPSFIGLFLPSSVVPGVCSIPAGSGARQDDAGGLSTSSMLPLKPFKMSCYLFTQKHLNNTQLWQDQKLTLSVVNTHSVCIKGILLRSSTSEFPFCKLLHKPNTLMPLIHIQRSVFAIWLLCHPWFLMTVPLQVQNASDLLIKPLEKFRKEQIGVTKVSAVGFCWLCCTMAENLDQMQSLTMTQQHPELLTQASSSARNCIYRYIYTLYRVIFVKWWWSVCWDWWNVAICCTGYLPTGSSVVSPQTHRSARDSLEVLLRSFSWYA